MGCLRVKNWVEFQHYGKRTPPWIKLHRTILEDYAIARLPDTAKAHLIGIWCLAAANDGSIPDDPMFVARKINATEHVDLQLLVEHGFLVPEAVLAPDASNMLAHDASNMLAHDASNMLAHDASTRREEKIREEKRREEAVHPSSIPDLPPVSVPYLTQCVMALNAGLSENRHLGGQFREVSSSEQAGSVTWEAEGIALETAVATIRRVAAHYRPKGQNRQPSSLRYFDAAVREAAFGKKRDGPRQPDRWVDPHRDRRPGQLNTSLNDLLPTVVGQITGAA